MKPIAQSYSFWDTVSRDAVVAGGIVNLNASFISRIWQVRRLARMRPSFACVFWLRVNQLFVRRRWRGCFRIRIWRQYRFANSISEYADIGPGLFLPHPTDVTIGSAVKIGRNVTIYNGVTLGGKHFGGDDGMPHLGDNVIVYTGAKVIGAVQIGDDAEIGALSLCNKNVLSKNVMYGIPPNVTIRPKKLS